MSDTPPIKGPPSPPTFCEHGVLVNAQGTPSCAPAPNEVPTLGEWALPGLMLVICVVGMGLALFRGAKLNEREEHEIEEELAAKPPLPQREQPKPPLPLGEGRGEGKAARNTNK